MSCLIVKGQSYRYPQIEQSFRQRKKCFWTLETLTLFTAGPVLVLPVFFERFIQKIIDNTANEKKKTSKKNSVDQFKGCLKLRG